MASNTTVAVTLRSRKHAGLVALVDRADEALVSGFDWHPMWDRHTRSFYAIATVREGNRRVPVRMHRLVVSANHHEFVDHVNNDTLDNRRTNLRLCSRSQNQANQRESAGKTSQYKGVRWNRECQKWQAQIGVQGKRHHLGLFTDERSAAAAYDSAARNVFAEYAKVNLATKSEQDAEARP